MSRLPSISLRALGSTVVLVTTDPAALQPARRLLVPALRALDLACSRFRDDSELIALTRAAGRATPVGEVLWAALEAALGVARSTGGLVDPTVGRAMRLAGYDRTFVSLKLRDGRLVRPEFEPAGRWCEIVLDPRRRTVLVPAGVELDLGATAKALVADQIASAAAACTAAGVLVSVGGDIAVAGEPPSGGWPVRIADDHASPLHADGPVVAIAEGGLASSGTRVRRWPTALGELHHVVDPATGRPATTPWHTVTVAAHSCLEANAASTAAVVLAEAAPAWLAQRGVSARLARSDGTVVRVGGWPGEELLAA